MPEVQLEQLTLSGLHRNTLGVVGVVVTEDVQHTVHDQQRQLVVDGAGVLG